MSDYIVLFLMGLSFWMFAYFIYLKLTQLLLSRMELHEPTRSHLIEGFWYTSFFVSSVVYCALTLIFDHKINSVNSMYELMTENVFEPRRLFTKCTLNYLPIVCSFYAHIVLVSLTKDGFNKDNLARLLFLLFILSAIVLRCRKAVHVGMLLFNSTALFSGICGILCALNRSPERRLQLTYILLWLCFILHCFVWLLVFLFLVPVILLLPAFTVKVQSSDLFILLLLNLTLWIFFCVQLGNSPLFRFIQVLCRKGKVSVKNRSIIDHILFPSHFLRSSELLKLREEFALYRRKWCSSRRFLTTMQQETYKRGMGKCIFEPWRVGQYSCVLSMVFSVHIAGIRSHLLALCRVNGLVYFPEGDTSPLKEEESVGTSSVGWKSKWKPTPLKNHVVSPTLVAEDVPLFKWYMTLCSSNSMSYTMDSPNANNKAKLFQTIKCVMALKRRIKKKRQENVCNALLDECCTRVLQDAVPDESCSTSLQVLDS